MRRRVKFEEIMEKRRANATRRAEIRSVIEKERVGVFTGNKMEDNIGDEIGQHARRDDSVFDIFNEMYGYSEPVCNIDDDGTPASALHCVVNLTENVLKLRSERSQNN